MIFRCATVVIHAPGLSGTPPAGHDFNAVANASCAASSARSNEPDMRIRLATIRLHSSRKTVSTMDSTSRMLRGQVFPDVLLQLRNIPERPYLDAPLPAAALRRNLRRPGNCLIQILAVDDVVPAELFFRLGKRTIGHQRLATLMPHRGCRHRRL